jgi:hypothetical protein
MTLLELGTDAYLKIFGTESYRKSRTRKKRGGSINRTAKGWLASTAMAVFALIIGGTLPALASDAATSAGGKRVLASDTGDLADPVPFWGQVECAQGNRHELIPSGGDPHPTATGQSQGNSSFRRIRVLDGDNFFGERCELGDNWAKGPTAFYREGRRRITAISLRLPPGFPVNAQTWQVVMQMKQSQPSANGGGSPALELQVFNGQWRLNQSGHTGLTSDSRKLWTWPARTGVWTRFSFDIKYSRSPRKGRIRVIADVNGDGDYLDATERKRKRRGFTLKRQLHNHRASVPSHLRAGIYHDPAISCPPPSGCEIHVDNVQVLAP